MEVQLDYMVYFYGYIIKLIDTQKDSLMLNDEYEKFIEGTYNNYEKVLELSLKMNKNIIDIMKAREVLSTYDTIYTQYTN